MQRLAPLEEEAAAPAFLDEVSGLYRSSTVDTETGEVEEDNDIIEIVRVGDFLLFAVPQNRPEGTTDMTIFGQLQTQPESGLPLLVSVLSLDNIARDEQPYASVEYRFVLGFDSIVGRGRLLPAPGSSVQPVDEGGEIRLQKLCDFDARIAGVFDTEVTKVNETGDCSGADNLSGPRAWAFTVGNAREASALLSMKEGKPEFGLRLSFSHYTQAFTLRSPFDLQTVHWLAGSTFAGTVGRDAETTHFETDFVRMSGSNCRQTYHAESVRVTGTKPGISCPLPAAQVCPLDLASCPLMDLGSFSLSFQATATAQSGGDGSCPETRCQTSFTPETLCDDESKLIAANGCQDNTYLAASASTKGNEEPCILFRCPPVGEDDDHCGSNHGTVKDRCDEPALVVVTQSERCLYTQCVAKDGRCPRPPPCDKFATGYELRSGGVDHNGCPLLWCSFGSGSAQALLADDGQPVTYYAKKQLLRGGYRISGIAAQPDEQTYGLLPALITNEMPNCPPLDMDMLRITCPASGYAGACLSPQEGPTYWQDFVLYRTQHSEALCFGIVDAYTGQKLSGFGFGASTCSPDQNHCCNAPRTSGEPVNAHLSCLYGTYFISGIAENVPASATLQLELQRNGSTVEPLQLIGNGMSQSISFTTEFLSGNTFAVVNVSTDAAASCTVQNGAGVVDGESIESVRVVCPP